MIDYEYQKEANISCLFEDKEYEERRISCFEVVKAFQKVGIRFGIACSFNLFLRGLVDEFHDFDIIVDINDIDKVEKIMQELGAEAVSTGGNGFCESEVYINYHLGRVDFDIISGFRVLTYGTSFLYQYSSEEIEEIKIFEEEIISIPLISLEALYLLYSMMEGWQPKRRFKRLIIQKILFEKKEDMKFKGILEDSLKKQNLPGWIKREVRRLIND